MLYKINVCKLIINDYNFHSFYVIFTLSTVSYTGYNLVIIYLSRVLCYKNMGKCNYSTTMYFMLAHLVIYVLFMSFKGTK